MILKKLKFFKAAALLSFAAAGALLFAQEYPNKEPADPKSDFDAFDLLPVSGTNKATYGTFRSDVDNYLRPTYWQTVDFSKVFGFVGYKDLATEGFGSLNGGFATKAGPLFIGAYAAWKNGYIAKFGEADFVKTVDTTYIDPENGNYAVDHTTTTENVTGNPFTESNNSVFVLIGWKNMGFKLGVVEDLKTSSKFQPDISIITTFDLPTDYISKVTNYADGRYSSEKWEDMSYALGNVAPSLQWAMSLPIGSMTLTPGVHALVKFGNGFDYYNKNGKWEKIPTMSAKYKKLVKDEDGSVTSDETTDFKFKAGYINPAFKVGAELTINPAMAVELHYAIGFNVYNNDYGLNVTTTEKSPIQTGATTTDTTTETKYNYKYNSDIGHYIEPAFKYTKNFTDKFTLKSKVLMGIGFSSYDRDSQYNKTETTMYNTDDPKDSYTEIKTTDGNNIFLDEKLSKFTLTPSVALGTQYNALPGRLAVNAGIKVTPFIYETKTEKTSPDGQVIRTTTKYDDGRYVPDKIEYKLPKEWEDKTTVSSHFYGASVSFGAGFTFNFTPGFVLDVSYNTTDFVKQLKFDYIDMSKFSVLFSLKGLPSIAVESEE